jgi:hypothetical protein
MEQPDVSIPREHADAQAVAHQFLHWLYGDEAPGWLTIWLWPTKHTQWFHATHLDQAAAYAVKQAQSCDAYVGVGLRRKPLDRAKRGDVREVIAIPGLWMDLDLQHPVHKKQHLPKTIQDVRTLLSEATPRPPSLLIHSGYGVHGYWLFREVWRLESAVEQDAARQLLYRFQETIIAAGKRRGWDLDSTFSLAQVLRIPGTLNHKIAGEAREVAIL